MVRSRYPSRRVALALAISLSDSSKLLTRNGSRVRSQRKFVRLSNRVYRAIVRE